MTSHYHHPTAELTVCTDLDSPSDDPSEWKHGHKTDWCKMEVEHKHCGLERVVRFCALSCNTCPPVPSPPPPPSPRPPPHHRPEKPQHPPPSPQPPPPLTLPLQPSSPLSPLLVTVAAAAALARFRLRARAGPRAFDGTSSGAARAALAYWGTRHRRLEPDGLGSAAAPGRGAGLGSRECRHSGRKLRRVGHGWGRGATDGAKERWRI